MENEKIKEHIQKQNQVKLVLCIATGIIVVALWGIGIIGLTRVRCLGLKRF